MRTIFGESAAEWPPIAMVADMRPQDALSSSYHFGNNLLIGPIKKRMLDKVRPHGPYARRLISATITT